MEDNTGTWVVVGIIAFFILLGILYLQIPVCDRLTRDLSPNQLKECFEK